MFFGDWWNHCEFPMFKLGITVLGFCKMTSSCLCFQDKVWRSRESQWHNCGKPELSTIEHGYQMDGWQLCARLFTHPGDFSSVKFCTDPTKVHQMRLKTEIPQVYICLQKRSHTHYKSSGPCQSWMDYWKHQNNPAYAKSARVFSLEVGHYAKEETKDEDGIL